MYSARELAMTRMEEEADMLQADGIVGVRLEVIRHAWGASMAEFVAIGTAVKGRASRATGARPAAGRSRPISAARTSGRCCAPAIAPSRWSWAPAFITWRTAAWASGSSKSWQNVEMTNFTQALYEARELALERMQEEAQEVQAEGIVGVDIEERTYGWDAHVIEYFAVGTAIVPFGEAQPISVPVFTLSLNDTTHKIIAPPAPPPTPGGAAH